jgi:hypothetical protein
MNSKVNLSSNSESVASRSSYQGKETNALSAESEITDKEAAFLELLRKCRRMIFSPDGSLGKDDMQQIRNFVEKEKILVDIIPKINGTYSIENSALGIAAASGNTSMISDV